MGSSQFEETLESASPDVLREMTREFAQRMMDAEVEVRLRRRVREVSPDRAARSRRFTAAPGGRG
jgi:hypothetical protein